MAKTLMGQFGAAHPAQLSSENARLRARVAELSAERDRLLEENDRLSALHSADLDTELANELADA